MVHVGNGFAAFKWDCVPAFVRRLGISTQEFAVCLLILSEMVESFLRNFMICLIFLKAQSYHYAFAFPTLHYPFIS